MSRYSEAMTTITGRLVTIEAITFRQVVTSHGVRTVTDVTFTDGTSATTIPGGKCAVFPRMVGGEYRAWERGGFLIDIDYP